MKKIIRMVYRLMMKVLIRISPMLSSKILYSYTTGKKLNLNNPQNFNEKLQWLKFNWQHPLVITCTDRFECRNFVKEKGFEEILIKCHGVFNNVKEIDWNKLPQQFVMKTNNGCGNHIICLDKSSLDKKKASKHLNKYMRLNYSLLSAEMHYEKISPKIVCEEYLSQDGEDSLIDYKIYCFNGIPKIILLCLGRQGEQELKRFFLDLKWVKIDIAGTSINHGKVPIQAPSCLEQMLYYAEQLSQGIPFVRIDFYVHNNKPKLGEMTFTPMACMAGPDYYSEKGLKILGDMLELPKKTYFNFSSECDT